jgi:hypothetical protein
MIAAHTHRMRGCYRLPDASSAGRLTIHDDLWAAYEARAA